MLSQSSPGPSGCRRPHRLCSDSPSGSRPTTSPINRLAGTAPSWRLSVLSTGLSPSNQSPVLSTRLSRLIRRSPLRWGCQVTTTDSRLGAAFCFRCLTRTRSPGSRVGCIERPSMRSSRRRPQKSSNRSRRPAAAMGGLVLFELRMR